MLINGYNFNIVIADYLMNKEFRTTKSPYIINKDIPYIPKLLLIININNYFRNFSYNFRGIAVD